ncbi:MAG TPA: hypothetical protein PLX56_12875, partial [bacterium]|nr:hypothetical protein [bacterium]
MKKILFLIIAVFSVLTSCEDGGRPNTKDEFSIDINGTSILKNATVSLFNDSDKEIMDGVTDENGLFVFEDVQSATGLLVKVCGGSFYSVATDSDVSFTGCLEESIPLSQGNVSVTVDILSTFISKYDSETSTEEWQTYLDITTLPSPALQSSLTDASKRYLWYQGIAKIAENVSKANSVTPETMYSTENLLNLLLADLADDNIINGSTKAKFGTLNVEALILKSVLA